MEEFKKIDWLPSLEDIIDNKFLNEERLQAEGAMYQIMNGVFQDPFQEIRPRMHFLQSNANEAKKTETQPDNKKKVGAKKRTKSKKKKAQNKAVK